MRRLIVLALLVLVAVVVWVSVVPVQAREEIKLTTIVPDQQVVRIKKGIVSEANYKSAVFPDTSILAKSLIIDEGSVGIGTTNPQGKLDVNGSIAVGGQQGASGQVLTSQGAGNVPVWSNTAGTVNAVQVSSSILITAPLSYVAMPGMTLTINTTVPNSKVLISFSGSFKNRLNAGQGIRLMINGAVKFETVGGENIAPDNWNVNSFQWVERFPSAGAQTISIVWKNCVRANCSNTDNLPYVLNAIELR